MYSGYVRFHAIVEDLELPQMSISSIDPQVSSVELIAPAGSPLEITVRFVSIATEEDARVAARAVAVDIADRVAFELKLSVGDPWHESEAFSPVTGSAPAGGAIMLGQSIGFSTTGAVWVRPNTSAIASLKTTLETPTSALVGYHLMSTYRSALKVKNPVDRFLCLYNILLLKNGDNQKAVDIFIQTHDPGVATSPSPKFPGVIETVYTRLRNEFSHIRSGTTFDRTRQEMEQNLAGLKEMAGRACQIP